MIIISLGGSLIAPKTANAAARAEALHTYANWLIKLSATQSVVAIVGGGYTARVMMDEAKKTQPDISADDLDWIGIKATYDNAKHLQLECGTAVVQSDLITNPAVTLTHDHGLVIGAGWKPGHSTDYDAVYLAAYNGVTTVYNLTNVPAVYNKDPKQFSDAQPVADMTWAQLQQIVGTTWEPGLNMPFDPIAAQLAASKGITVKLVDGSNLANVNLALFNRPFQGTTIHL